MAYLNLLWRQQALMETDPVKGQADIAQADAIRNKAIQIFQPGKPRPRRRASPNALAKTGEDNVRNYRRRIQKRNSVSEVLTLPVSLGIHVVSRRGRGSDLDRRLPENSPAQVAQYFVASATPALPRPRRRSGGHAGGQAGRGSEEHSGDGAQRVRKVQPVTQQAHPPARKVASRVVSKVAWPWCRRGAVAASSPTPAPKSMRRYVSAATSRRGQIASSLISRWPGRLVSAPWIS